MESSDFEPLRNAAAPGDRRAGESDTAYVMFQAYAALPPSRRDIPILAKASGYAPGTLYNWSSSFDWAARASQLDAEAEVRAAVARKRLFGLIMDKIEDLDEGEERGELVKAANALAKLAPPPAASSLRHPQPRGGSGRFVKDESPTAVMRPASDIRRSIEATYLAAVPAIDTDDPSAGSVEPDPFCVCDCGQPVVDCAGGKCADCAENGQGEGAATA